MKRIYLTKNALSLFTILLFLVNTTFAQIAQRGTATVANTTGISLVIPKPAGIATGDVMLVNIAQQGTGALSNPTSTGWTLIAGANLNGGTNRWGTLLYKVATATDAAAATTNYTFALDAQANGSVGSIVAFSGVDVSGATPFDVAPGSISVQGSQTTVSATAITTVSANAAVIMFGQAAASSPTWSSWSTTSPGTLTELFDNQSTGNSTIGAAWAIKAAAGSTGNGSATLSASERNGGILIALKPIPPTPTITNFTPSSGCANTTPVVITGTNFTGATAVTFGGTAAISFTVNSATQITATPATGTTGTINVTAPGGSVTSASSFSINPLPTTVTVSGAGSFCNSVTITAANGSSGTIYFQGTTSGGTSTATPSTSKVVSTSGTYYFRAQSALGCWGTEGSAVVTINPAPTTVTVSGGGTFCNSTTITASNGSSGIIYFQGTTSGGTSTATPASSQVVSTSGTYYFRAQSAAGCWGAEGSVVVTINPAPTIVTVSGGGSVCNNATLTAANGSSGTIYFQGTTSGGTSTATPSNSQLISASGTYYFRAQSAAGCWGAEGSATVTINSAPAVVTVTGGGTICGSSMTIAAAGGSGGTIYFQGTTSGGTSTAIAGVSQSVTASGTYYFRAQSAAGCWGPEGSTTVTINALPTPTLLASSTNICPNSSVTFTAGGGTNYTFMVNGTSVQSGVSNTYTTNTLTNGNAVSVQVTNSNGCQATSTPINITVNSIPTGTLTTPSTTICSGDNIIFTATGGTSYQFKVNGTIVQSFSASNTYSTTGLANASVVTVDVLNASGCAATYPGIFISVTALPTGTLTATENSGTPNDNTICPGTSVNFSVTSGFSNYNFKVNGTSIQSGSSNTFSSATLSNSDIVTVVITAASGCSATLNSIAITVLPPPSGTLAASATTICPGTNVTFTASSGYANYSFNVNGAQQQNGTSNIYTNSALTNGAIITVDVTSAAGCLSTFNNIVITLSPVPSGTLTVTENSGVASNDFIICSGATVTFTATAGFTNYRFLLNGTQVQNGASNIHTNTTIGNGNAVTVEVTNSSGCISTFSSTAITVNSLPVVNPITGTNNVCVNSTTALANTTAGGVWASSNTAVATVTTTGLVSGIAAGTANITYSITNSNGCINASSMLVTVNALPIVPAITGGPGACLGNSQTLANTTPGGTWSSSNTAVATINGSGLLTGVSLGTTTITYSVTNVNGCTTATTLLVTVNSLTALPAVSGATPICGNTSTTYSNSTAGGTWSSSNTAVATVNAASGLVTGVSGGTANIIYSYTNVNGCTSSVFKTITINAAPVPTLSGPNPICQGSIGNVYTTQSGKSNYNWVVTNGTVTAGGTTASSTITISWLAVGTKNITVNYTDVNGCVGATSATVANAPSSTLPTISGPSSVCVNATGNIYTTEASKSFYTWTITGGVITSGGTATSNTATVTWNSVGARSISVNYSDAFGCNAASPTVYPVTVNPLPTATVSGTIAVCQNGTQPTITFTGSNATAPYTFTYTVNGGGNQTINSVGNSINIPVSTAVAGTFTYTLVSVKECSCSGTSCSQLQTGSATITINALPVVIITNPASVCSPATVNLTVAAVTTGSTAGLTYTYWTDAAASSAYATPATAAAGTYYIKGTNASGCYDIKPVIVTVNPLPSVVITNPVGVCSPATVNLTAAAITAGSTAGLTYTYWTNSTATTAYGTPAAATAGTYYIKGTTASGCYDIQPVTVTVNPTPTVVIVTPAAVCSPATVNLTLAAVTTGSTAGLTFTYFTNAAATAAYATPAAATAGTYYIKGTNASGCYDVKPVTVTVNALPTVVITNPVAVCFSATVNLTLAAVTTGSTAGLTFTYWTNASASTAYPTATAATAGTYYIKGTNASGCYDIEPVSATVNPLPTVVINTPAAVCSPSTVDLTSAAVTSGSTAGITFTYFTNAAGTTVYATPAAATAGTYYIKGTSASGCIDIKAVTVTVNAIPAAPVLTPISATFCQGVIQTLTSGTAATWSPVTDLFTNAAATTAYTGQTLTTVYAKPATAGTKIYTATVTNAAGCTNSANTTLTVNPIPVVTISSDYCTVAGKVRLTASTVPSGATYVWNTGQTGSVIDVDIASVYSATATLATGCSATGSVNVAVELVANGDFSAGNTGFSTEYTYTADIAGNTELYPEGYYAVGTSGQNYHNAFYGKEHTTPAQTGNFMLINGSTSLIGSPARQRTIWQETVAVIANTNYYFSAYGMNLNPGSPAQLQFEVNGVAVGTIADLNLAPKPNSDATVNINNWLRFYSNPTWNSGSATTAVIRIINLNTAAGGNDFALDDISFSTLSTFIKLLSLTGSDAQTTCINTPITDIVYSVGSGATGPVVTGLPAGVTSIFNGVNLTISGTPTVAGNYTYSVTTVGNCNSITANGTINVQAQTIALTSGSSVQTVCSNTAISNIVYTIGGNATNATVTGLPTGVAMTKSGNVFTISGTPSVAGTFAYTITTSGVCNAATATGTITAQAQSITLTSGSTTPTICINNAVTNIVYTIGGTGTGASVTGLPSGVTGAFNSGFFAISGTPVQAGVFNYTITTTGTCGVATATGTITVQQQTITLSSGNATQAFCVGSPMGTIVYNVGGSATGASASGLPTGVSGVYNAGVFTISGTPSQSGTFNYTVTTAGGCVTATAVGTLTSGVNTWTGAVSANWSTVGNWSCGAVPIIVTDVVIPTGAPNMPQLTATSVSKSIVLQAGTFLDLNGQSFNTYGAVTGTGIFKGSVTSNLTFNAAGAASSIYLDQTTDATTNALSNLTINGSGSSLLLNNKVSVYGTLTPAAGTLTINDILVLRSTASSTASVGEVTGAIAYGASGKVEVQRYFPSLRSWRLITSPLSNTGSIYNSWQNGGVNVTGQGTLVTGPILGNATNGLDNGPFLNPSLKTGSNLTNVSDTKNMLLSNNTASAANIGYLMFVRGDRNPINTIVPNTNITTLSSKGKLQTGQQTFAASATSGAYTLIGNPYAAPVDLHKVTLNNLVKRFYVWDPKLSTVGGYILLTDITNTGTFTVTPSSPGNANQYVQSSEAFFVQTSTLGTAASIVFNESNKGTSLNNNLGIFRPMAPETPAVPATPAARQSLRANLYLRNADGTTHMADGNLTEFGEGYNPGIDLQDALKFINPNETFGILSGTTLLALDRRPILVNTDTVFYKFMRNRQLKYQFEFTTQLLDRDNLAGFVEDKFLNRLSPIVMNGTTKMNFEITGVAASAAMDRFRVVFQPSVVYTNLTATVVNSDILVEWSNGNEFDIKAYEVERSTDGINFSKQSTVAATGNNNSAVNYNWLDQSPALGLYYYRIRSISNSDVVGHSNIVKVKINRSTPAMYVFPNPVTQNTIQLQMNGLAQGVYTARLLNSLGQSIETYTINHAGGTATETIKPAVKLITGSYILQVAAPDKKITTIKVIVN